MKCLEQNSNYEIWELDISRDSKWLLRLNLPLNEKRAIAIIRIIVPRCKTLIDLKHNFILRYGEVISQQGILGQLLKEYER